MPTYTIPAKKLGTGTICDIASPLCDRVIDFGEDGKYAIVFASFYMRPDENGNGVYVIARDMDAALDISNRVIGYAHAIIDCHGVVFLSKLE